MENGQQMNNYQQNNEQFVSILEELTKIKETYIANEIAWYAKQAPRNRRFFNASSVLVIFISISIPYLTTLEGIWRTTVLPIAALLLAALTGLSSFFHWERSWRGNIQSKLKLEHLLWTWEMEIMEAKHEVDTKKGIDMAFQATKRLLENAQATISSETEEFFKLVEFPPKQHR